eukprot:CAMPEP_0113301238 /NCGR_PEP_ID=MMETSP0010_2-20120614/2549_1 /TAXON_ID=216773 ORGANISM="Corethron hystrix, Strain 308" /NCGR_SAMPLE_ID=MMETSP0010_2 /ASSEMBLY_ACC=CAM_ASM_000155 /LENGTH=663 /DNA_ID=CAMNT_0000154825 /DNA_START=196 /DNA_END=2187 /DNA_ORIENTATION=+ /assembly_acc=CAM_ASM_000155
MHRIVSVPTASGNVEPGSAEHLDGRGLLQFDTLHELQSRAALTWPNNPLFGTHITNEKGGEEYEWMTYREFDEHVDAAIGVLSDLGITEGSTVGIISNNRWEWVATTSAAHNLKAAVVPMYEAQLASDWTYILNDASCSVVLCANQEIFDRVQRDVVPNVPSLKAVLAYDAKDEGAEYAFQTRMQEAAAAGASSASTLLSPSPDDLASLIYTSGTTGKPKGVELTHSNHVTNLAGVRCMVSDPTDFVRTTDRSLSFLPWAHSYGQTCELWMLMAHGSSLGVCRGVPSILEDLQLVKPTMLFSVPTLFKRIYDGVNNMMENTNPIRRGLMKTALGLGEAHRLAEAGEGPALGPIQNFKYNALDKIVLSKIRDRFGGNLRLGFVAGAACPTEIVTFLDDVGIQVCEGYGLTETSPIITICSPERRKYGSVGQPIGGVHVLIMGENGEVLPPGKEGEVCCYGPNVMVGYHGKPAETDEVISLAPDGISRLFHTGDMGKMTEDGFLSITGRLKEQYKLENGKYIVPTPIEEAIGMSRFVQQVILTGANRPYNVVLLVPDWAAVRSHLKIEESVDESDLVNDDRVKALIDEEIISNCKKMKKFEVPRKWAFIAPCTAANNMLTPKMSIRRHVVIKTYDDIVSQMYEEAPTVDVGGSFEREMKKKEAAA